MNAKLVNVELSLNAARTAMEVRDAHHIYAVRQDVSFCPDDFGIAAEGWLHPRVESSRGSLAACETPPQVFHQFLRAAPDATRRCCAFFRVPETRWLPLGRSPSCGEDCSGLGFRTEPRGMKIVP